MPAPDHIRRVSEGDPLSAERDGQILDLLGRECTGPGVVGDDAGFHHHTKARKGLVWFELTEAITYPGSDQTPYTDNPTRVFHDPATDLYGASTVAPWRIYAPGAPRDPVTGYYVGRTTFATGMRFAAFYNFQSDRWEMTFVDNKAEAITFTLLEDMGETLAGSALATINDYYRGYDPAEAGFRVYDPQGLFPRALNGAKGKATYDDRSDEYHITECQQMATVCGCTASADVASGDATWVPSGVEVMFPIVGQTPTIATVRNTFSDEMTSGQTVIIGWNETDDAWDVLEIKRLETRFWVITQTNWEAKAGGESHDKVSVKRCNIDGSSPTGAAFDMWLPDAGEMKPNVVVGEVLACGLMSDGSYICLSDYLDEDFYTIEWFSGTIANIREGWALCDGTANSAGNGGDGTDLSRRFIMCVGESQGLDDEDDVGDSGGHRWHGETENNHHDHPSHVHPPAVVAGAFDNIEGRSAQEDYSAGPKQATTETTTLVNPAEHDDHLHEMTVDVREAWDGNYNSDTEEFAPGATDEVQTLTFVGTPSAGTFTLTIVNFFGAGHPNNAPVTTDAIAWNANVAAIQTAIDNVIGAGNVTVASGDFGDASWDDGDEITITFDGGLYEGLPQTLIVDDSALLTDSDITVSRTTETGHLPLNEHLGGPHDGTTAAGADPHAGDNIDTDNRPPFYVLAAKQRIDNSV
jgi:hypothetical protein